MKRPCLVQVVTRKSQVDLEGEKAKTEQVAKR